MVAENHRLHALALIHFCYDGDDTTTYLDEVQNRLFSLHTHLQQLPPALWSTMYCCLRHVL